MGAKKLDKLNKLKTMEFVVVEDCPAMRKSIDDIFQDLGITKCSFLENGKLALDFLEKEKSRLKSNCVLISDIQMPEMDGLSLLKKVRAIKEYRDTPILMASSEKEPSIMLDAIEKGANFFVMKPFGKNTLLKKLSLIVD